MFCLKMLDLAKHLLRAYKPHVAWAEGQPGVLMNGGGVKIGAEEQIAQGGRVEKKLAVGFHAFGVEVAMTG